MADASLPAALAPPPAVLRLVDRLEKAGHEAWCVGGAVRDALLGHRHLDWDIATSARPEQVQRIFKRTVPVGIAFGTIGVLTGDGVLHEVTTFRRDVKTDGRHAEVEFGVSLDDDLARRDFTVNAIAFSPSRNELRDPFHGRRDLEQRVVRAVGDAGARMREDRLRALRGIRFAARFGFTLDPATWRAIEESAPHLGRLSAERVKQEIEKTLDQVVCPSVAFTMWRASGSFAALVPALSGTTTEQFEIVDHLARPGLRTRPARHLLRLAALFIGQPAASVRLALKALRFSNLDINNAVRLLEAWTATGSAMASALTQPEPPSDAQIRRWVATIGRTQWTLLVRLGSAVWSAARAQSREAPSAAAVHSLYRRGVRIAYRDPVDITDLAVDGDDLREAGVAPGPGIGRCLGDLLAVVLDDPSKNTRDTLLQIARERVR